MSDNVGSVKLIEGQLKIRYLVAVWLEKEHRDALPETNFVSQAIRAGDRTFLENTIYDPELFVDFNRLWSGEGSGWSFGKGVFEDCLKRTIGHAKFVVIFDSGDMIGFEVNSGVIQHKKAKIVLED